MSLTPTEALTQALVEMADRKERPPCSEEPDLWISDSTSDRAQAARRCGPCPIKAECAAAAEANQEVFVWGGIDYGTQPAKRRRSQK